MELINVVLVYLVSLLSFETIQRLQMQSHSLIWTLLLNLVSNVLRIDELLLLKLHEIPRPFGAPHSLTNLLLGLAMHARNEACLMILTFKDRDALLDKEVLALIGRELSNLVPSFGILAWPNALLRSYDIVHDLFDILVPNRNVDVDQALQLRS